MPLVRRSLGMALLLAALGSGGCTLAKPIVGVVTGPAVILGNSGDLFGGGCHDLRAWGCAFVMMSAVGAGAGLVTGIISDVQVLCGDAPDPCNNWWDPFATNTSR